MSSRKELEFGLDHALALEREGKFGEARKALQGLLAQYIDHAALLGCLSQIEREMGLLDEALINAKKSVDLAPRVETASLLYFFALWDKGDIELAAIELLPFSHLQRSTWYRDIASDLLDVMDVSYPDLHDLRQQLHKYIASIET